MTSPRRVLLKVSGEVFSGPGKPGIDTATLGHFADELVATRDLDVELALVVGGGNFLRGAKLAGSGPPDASRTETVGTIDRVSADFMGMLATMMNGIALASALARRNTDGRVLSALEVGGVVERYTPKGCVEHLKKGRIAILVGGTGNPFFTTDTCASLRAVEIGASILLKGTKVDGVYSADPVTVPTAHRYEKITYDDVLRERLEVMDATAIALSMENELPILIFNVFADGHLRRALEDGGVGSLVCPVS